MAYVSKARRQTPDLRKPLPGNGTSLPPGKSHKVTIEHANTIKDTIAVVFKDSFGESHVERVFRLGKDGDDISGVLKQLIAAIANDSSEVKDLYDSFLDGNNDGTVFIGRSCVIETEYRGDFVNIKTVRSGNDRDNGGSFFQPVEANTTHKTGTTDTEKPRKFIGLSEAANSFF